MAHLKKWGGGDHGGFYGLLVLARGRSLFRLDHNGDVKNVEPLSFVFLHQSQISLSHRKHQ